MKTIRTGLALALAASLASPLLAQGPTPPPALPGSDAPVAAESKLVPGALPADTTERAKTLWKALTDATLVAGAARQPVTSFRLPFDLRLQMDEVKSNELHVTYSFLAQKDYVRFTLESGREIFRGPDGDFTLTGDGKVIRLVGRDFSEDRQQLDDAARISKNFVALTDPGRLRIARLRTEVQAPTGLPKKLQKRAAKLTWIEVDSPDFHLVRTSKTGNRKAPLFRALLGLDPKTNRIELAELREAQRSTTAPVLIRFERYQPLDGFQIPHELKFYELAPNPSRKMFRNKPTSDLVLIEDAGTLRANLKPKDFVLAQD